jgi:aminoglycoside phosphotransferase family enzyme
MNYIWYAIMTTKKFSGAFAEMFEEFYSTYMNLTGDTEIRQTLPLFFAFRGVVVAHPIFYHDQTDQTRKKIFRFINNVLQYGHFDPKKIHQYIE